jgi:hypothetical protein
MPHFHANGSHRLVPACTHPRLRMLFANSQGTPVDADSFQQLLDSGQLQPTVVDSQGTCLEARYLNPGEQCQQWWIALSAFQLPQGAAFCWRNTSTATWESFEDGEQVAAVRLHSDGSAANAAPATLAQLEVHLRAFKIPVVWGFHGGYFYSAQCHDQQMLGHNTSKC